MTEQTHDIGLVVKRTESLFSWTFNESTSLTLLQNGKHIQYALSLLTFH